MIDIVVALISHNELTRRGEEVLRRSLNSLTRAMDVVARERPGTDVYIGCCDDASSDRTPDFIAEHFAGRSGFDLVQNRVNHFAGFSRNIAAARFKTEVICFLDADDEFKENHLVISSDIMTKWHDKSGRPLAAAYTLAEFNVPVHPEWIPRISKTIPLTKVIRRIAWEFVEGAPMESIYSVTGCEDQFLMQKLARVFLLPMFSDVTVRYHSYPGSYFERQLHKFSKPLGEYNPSTDDPVELRQAYLAREHHERAFIHYLEGKWNVLGWKDKLLGYALSG